MPTVRDTIDPTYEREVSDEEALDLERMGLLLTGTRARTPEGLRAAAVRQISDQPDGDALAGPVATIGVGGPADGEPTAHEPTDGDNQDPGDAPGEHDTDDTPDNTQES